MSEPKQKDSAGLEVIAFYLPQYHPIPENDEWWGPGFSEWTNAAKARPLFRGHRQPLIPADLGFYDLRCAETREAQAALARRYGVTGFCYYHYWFAGHRLLERPFNEVLASGEPDFPFCLCWANQTWTGIWHGAPNRILIEQTYPGDEDYRRHFDTLLAAFRDPRYIRIDGRPLFVIYRPTELPDARHFARFWNDMARAAGLPGLYLVGVNHDDSWRPQPVGFDARILQKLSIKDRSLLPGMGMTKLKARMNGSQLTVRPYAEVIETMLRKPKADCVEFPCVIPNWDNTPRSGMNGLVYQGATPELFRTLFGRAVDKCRRHLPEGERVVFVKAWNEWAEGNHLEPDTEHGHGWLRAIRDELAAGAG